MAEPRGPNGLYEVSMSIPAIERMAYSNRFDPEQMLIDAEENDELNERYYEGVTFSFGDPFRVKE